MSQISDAELVTLLTDQLSKVYFNTLRVVRQGTEIHRHDFSPSTTADPNFDLTNGLRLIVDLQPGTRPVGPLANITITDQ
jgi:hypothetical protein